MKIIGMSRIRNEARWIKRVIEAQLPLVDRLVILDDHSDDGTPEICAGYPEVELIHSPFEGLNETRDKQYLFECVLEHKPDVVYHADGDEELEPRGPEIIRQTLPEFPKSHYFRMPIVYLWDSPNQMRVDRLYGTFKRGSLFRPLRDAQFRSTSAGGNFHCGNIPYPTGMHGECPARLLHYGYMHAEDRVRKYEFYNGKDPRNLAEDCYRHMVIGDIYPAQSRFLHAGPLKLEPLSV